ncbi:hypothetical protein D6C86_03695 [Aureobasidium pullulans]|uniref:Uncharacterized protein n=1 Tax=Aureobasidium pullulans TaxID=5580 RepID=A0A4S9V932_AURPU|nr:hypothetical protein D6C94_04056 [Aureobasidium pullulans]THZ47497.1 hypothetical protein D6C87_01336 [Aureobasidium pullulans]THZ51805.1 hypothetical protein D6C88_09737 [Aureobasidium pullulans]THZ62471.1 hypothetical protein D6C86_03695 [Aureobasidium pullulans]
MFTVFGNHTELVSWTAEPQRRGSFGILSSCLVTIFLCLWTALHLNIPHYSDATHPWYIKRQMWRKLGWLTLGLLAPEMIVYAAWDQWRKAKKLKKAIHDEEGHKDWSMVHAFYAVMGGFVVDSNEESPLYPECAQRKRITLSPTGVQYIAEHHSHLLPHVEEAEVRDKSKANALAKFLVCIQAGWFVLQCISRMVLSLPITLLELNTFGHSICALIIYIFWWSKPLDVEQPTPIKSKEAQDLFAFLCMNSKDFRPLYRRNRSNKAEMDYLTITSDLEEANPEVPRPKSRNSPSFNRTALSETLERILELVPRIGDIKRNYGQGAKPVTRGMNTIVLKKDQIHFETGISNLHDTIELRKEDIHRWTLAANMMRAAQADHNKIGNTVVRRSRNWPTMDLDPKALDWILLASFNALSILYGGLHALAWNAEFVTPKRQNTWRLASLFVITFVPALTLVLLIENLVTFGIESNFVGRGVMLKINRFMYDWQIWQVLLVLGSLMYLWARAFLVVESFLSLAHSPAGVYDLPRWSAYVPHIT